MDPVVPKAKVERVRDGIKVPFEEFSVWIWAPRALFRLRGVNTGWLRLFQQRFVVDARWDLGRLFNLPETIEYAWPAVVMVRLFPLINSGVLVDIDGRLGLLGITRLSRRRVVDALRAADFAVIEVQQWGWEKPHRVPAAALGEYVDQVPSCVVADR